MMRSESRDLEFNPDEILDVMESFIDELQTRIANKSGENIQTKVKEKSKTLVNFGIKQQTEKERKEKQLKQEEDYWIKMASIIPEKKSQQWTALDRYLTK